MGFEGYQAVAFALAVYIVYSAVIFYHINKVQPTPYMDEVFHVPQTQKFCNFTFNEWDPKITTLPGTYLIAAAILVPLNKIGIIRGYPCTTWNLRAYNLVVGALNFLILLKILKYYMPTASTSRRTLTAFNMATVPVLYFFSFLFYTDMTSTFLLLAMHLQYLRANFYTSAFIGFVAVLARQTNIIWVGWTALVICLDMFFDFIWKLGIEYQKVFGKPQTIIKNTFDITRRYDTKVNKEIACKRMVRIVVPVESKSTYDLFFWSLQNIIDKKFFKMLPGYFIVMSVFLVFVWWNGGIVVGDKSAHTLQLNVPQLGYFALVYGLLCYPFVIFRYRSTLKEMKNEKRLILLIVVALLAVYFNTVAHPYLLADNRHYTFYFWRRLNSNNYYKYIMVVVYVKIWCFLVYNADVRATYIQAFVICCIAQLVPTLLLEFRYFIPMYMFARITMKDVSRKELICECVSYAIVNWFTVFMFLNKPFKWPNVDEPQRFMW